MARTKRIASRELSKWIAKTGTTQAKLAAILGVSAASVCRWLDGSRRPGHRMAQAVAAWTGGAIPARAWLRDDELEAFDALAAIRAGAKS